LKIDKRLNIVVPIETNGGVLQVHCTPLSAEAFDLHFAAIAKVFAIIHGEGYGALAGPRIAAKVLREVARASGSWEGPMGVEEGIINEIRRTSLVVKPNREKMLLHDAVQKGVLDKADVDILENTIVFFIVISAMHRPAVLTKLVEDMCLMWGAHSTSLTSTAWAASLPTSTETASTGATATAA
jgi:hypothetical protein